MLAISTLPPVEPTVRTSPSNRCGLQCLAYVALLSDRPVEAERVLRFVVQHPDGLSALQVKNLGAEAGVELWPTYLDENSFTKHIESGNLAIMLNQDLNHYLVAENVSDSVMSFRVIDVVAGSSEIRKYAEFDSLFSRLGLLTPDPRFPIAPDATLSAKEHGPIIGCIVSIILLAVAAGCWVYRAAREQASGGIPRNNCSKELGSLTTLVGIALSISMLFATAVTARADQVLAESVQVLPSLKLHETSAIALESASGVLTVEVILNEIHKVRLVVDTGAAITTLNPGVVPATIADLLGPIPLQGIARSAIGVGMRLESIDLGAVSIEDTVVAVSKVDLDLPGDAAGVLGYDIIGKYSFAIDPARRTLHLAEASRVWGSMDDGFALHHDSNLPLIETQYSVDNAAGAFWVIFDSGFNGELMLRDSPQSRFLLDQSPSGWWRQFFSGVLGDIEGRQFEILELKAFSRTFGRVLASIPRGASGGFDPGSLDGRIGIGALPRHCAIGFSPQFDKGWIIVTPLDPALEEDENVRTQLMVQNRSEFERASLRYLPASTEGGSPNLSANAIFLSSWHGRTQEVKELISVGADPGKELPSGVTPLLLAVERGHWETVVALVSAGATASTSAEGYGSAISSAAYHGYTQILETLLDAGASPNFVEGRFPAPPPLFAAAQGGSIDAIDLLVAAGADVDLVAPNGSSPLSLAAKSGNPAAVAKLLSLGLDPSHRDASGQSPLDLALTFGHLDVARLLLDETFDVQQPPTVSD